MADNLKVLSSDEVAAVPVRTIEIGGVHYPAFILADAEGNPIGSLNGALDIHDADVHKMMFNELFHRHTGTNTTIRVAASAGDTSIDVVNAAGLANGSFLELENGITEPTFPQITNIAGTVLTLDRPIDQDFPIGANVQQISVDMNVAGSLAAPVIFKVEPDNAEYWHIVSFILSATFPNAPADDLFGDQAALTNGCVLRGYSGTTGQYRTFTNWKTNADIKLDMYDLPYTDKAGGTNHGMNGNGDIKNRTGATPHLDSAAGDVIELLIQDDLTGLASFKLKAQGHVEGI